MLVVFISLVFSILPAVFALSLDVSGPDSIAENASLPNKLIVTFDRWAPDILLRAEIENQTSEKILGEWLKDPQNYNFVPQPFSYNITVFGTNMSVQYPNITFQFTITASGRRNVSGSCDTPWESSQPASAVINANALGCIGCSLKNVFNSSISLPEDICIDTVSWHVSDKDIRVETTMRKECGNSKYFGQTIVESGWISRTLPNSNFQPISGTPHKYIIIEPFDNNSLNNKSAFGSDIESQKNKLLGGVGRGGIFKKLSTQYGGSGQWEYLPYQPDCSGDGALWNCPIGSENCNITICYFDERATYGIIYYPPNGPKLCAWTNYSETIPIPWNKSIKIDNSTNFARPYSYIWTEDGIRSAISCPECVIERYDISATENVNFVYNSTTPPINVSAFTDVTNLTKNYTINISLSDFGLRSPNESFTLIVRAMANGVEITNVSKEFSVCLDEDGDGYCGQFDCDESDNTTYFGAQELCDGKDNNCDGRIDEGWPELGQPCGDPNVSEVDWIGACLGRISCAQNKSGYICANELGLPPFVPGEVNEICGNGVDDDCDGSIDEIDCKYTEGDKKPCGSNQSWFWCGQGFQVWLSGKWSNCIYQKQPRTEICNGIDDDCDGIIDNIGGKSSVAATKCQCWNGGSPISENSQPCNGVDDDCDGSIDEDQTCCQTGDKKSCSELGFTGICASGIASCQKGAWDLTDCYKGTVEICGNGIDEDCDGSVDENCAQTGCFNNQQDQGEQGIDCGGICERPCEYGLAPLWYGISTVGFVMIVIIAFMFLKPKS
jgi:hypothetical protein